MKTILTAAACIGIATASAIGVLSYQAKIDREAAAARYSHEYTMEQARRNSRHHGQLVEAQLRPLVTP